MKNLLNSIAALFILCLLVSSCQLSEKENIDQNVKLSIEQMQEVLEKSNYAGITLDDAFILNHPAKNLTKSEFEAVVNKSVEEREAFIKQQDKYNEEYKKVMDEMHTISDFVEKYEFAKKYPQFISIGEGVTQRYLKLKAERSEKE